MNRSNRFFLTLLAVMMILPAVACGGRNARKEEGGILHSDYGGCRIQGRHYHNTHVFIGDQYEPSLSEWLKY